MITPYTSSNRDGRKYERASNVCVKFFLARVKSVPNFTLFCCKNELCCDFVLCRVILITFKLVYFKKRKFVIYNIIVASIDVWQSYFAHSFCKMHFTLVCCKFTFLAIYTLFLVNKSLG